MDYSPPALATDPRRQAHFYSPTIGSYDRWAITYGYAGAGTDPSADLRGAKGGTTPAAAWTPEVELNALRAIASQAADPDHLYGSDEDAGFGGYGLDPTVSRYDQTADPLRWARERVGLIDWLVDSLETRVVAPGQGYGRLRSAFTDLLNDRWYALLLTTKYLGGAAIARDHRGDPDARASVVTVPADRQREALAFIADAGFGDHQAHRPRSRASRGVTGPTRAPDPREQRDDGEEGEAARGAVRELDDHLRARRLRDDLAVAQRPMGAAARAGTRGADVGAPGDDAEVAGENTPREARDLGHWQVDR
jgi:hypothetical protein